MMGLGFRNSRFITCPVCGFSYYDPVDRQEHNKLHKRYLKAANKFRAIYSYPEREAMKRRADVALQKGRTVAERVAAVELFFQTYFSRSVQSCNFDLKHPPYKQYCAMLLNQQHIEDWLKPYPGVYRALVKKYGRKAGIHEGFTDYPLRQARARSVG